LPGKRHPVAQDRKAHYQGVERIEDVPNFPINPKSRGGRIMPPLTLHPQYIVDAVNQKHSVILPLAEFEALMENLEDLAAVAERREEPALSHDQLLAELKKDGLL
jgi:hypothetical protein